jgi:hypothetical protein
MVDRYCWKDGRPIFDITTGQLRRLQGKAKSWKYIGVQKWRQQIAGVPQQNDIWKKVWQPFREAKVNNFL